MGQRVTRFEREVSLDEARRWRDAERFDGLCRECRMGYGRCWACPPFDYDPAERLAKYSKMLLLASVIELDDKGLPLEQASEILGPERRFLQERLLRIEEERGGYALAFAGKCVYCEDMECTRLSGGECRHPEKVRPSLESWGFDVGAICGDLFGVKLLWSSDLALPPRLTLAGAVLLR